MLKYLHFLSPTSLTISATLCLEAGLPQPNFPSKLSHFFLFSALELPESISSLVQNWEI